MMTMIRAFVKEDIPQVVNLYLRVSGGQAYASSEELISFFNETFFGSPWYDESLPSLVYEDKGQIIGFLGRHVRKMLMKEKPIRAAFGSHLIAHPDHRGKAPGLLLLKTFLEGPQDFSYADGAGEKTVIMWEKMGGEIAHIYNIHWTRLLRPSRFVTMNLVKRKVFPQFIEFATRPLSWSFDAVLDVFPYSPMKVSLPVGRREDFSSETLLEWLPTFAHDKSLRPDYDKTFLQWLFKKITETHALGELYGAQLGGANGEVVGWYLHYLSARGIAQVITMAAKSGWFDKILDALIHDAKARGAVAVAGRIEPGLESLLTSKHCLFHYPGPWMLIHSKNQEILHAIQSGKAFLTRLEGEWWLPYPVGGFA